MTKARVLAGPAMAEDAAGRTDLISLAVADPMGGQTVETGGAGETAAVVLAGTVEVLAGSKRLGRAGGRRDVFDGPGEAIYAPPGITLALTATGGPASLAIASAPLDGAAAPAEARIITPADQRIAEVGKDNWQRTVRTILGPEHRAGRLLLGETINPAGNWSSYPPHKHDTHEPPREARLEEVYLFKVDPQGGFGVQLRYGTGGEYAARVYDGDAVAIRSGYHPVAAAPGYRLYYLWVMAGQGREMIPFLDPAHAWVQEGGPPPADGGSRLS
jgi:5-deoxy-glucuronate isomerase